MRRGEVWTVSGGRNYTGKPRPAVIIQDDRFDATRSVTVCAFTTQSVEAPLVRIEVEPDDANGLRQPCQVMVDKVTTVTREKLGKRVGRLGPEVMARIDRALLVFMGLAGRSPSNHAACDKPT